MDFNIAALHQEIARAPVRLDLAGEDVLVARVVRPRGQHRFGEHQAGVTRQRVLVEVTPVSDDRRDGQAPVVQHVAQRIAGLDAGMDDYVTKPFNPRELVSRVKAILRRSSGMPGGGRVLQVGNVRVDPARHEVRVGEAVVSLRAKEFELLEAFCRQPGIVLSRDRLLEDVWGFAYPGETRTVDVHVKQLREKLAGADAKIETVWGVGYKMVAPAP